MWLQIKILLWKSLQYRKKFWLGTVIEISIPCLIFILLDYLIVSKKVYDPTYDYTKSVFYKEALPVLLPSATAVSFLLMCSLTIKRIVNEKYSGMKELMKMMGLESWMIWTGWILHNLFINTLSITIILCILYFGRGRILEHSNFFLIWIFFIMYTIAGTFFCFAISSLFNQPLLALITGVIVWIPSYSLPIFTFLSRQFRNRLIYGLSLLFPNSTMTKAFITILYFEYNKTGLQLSSIFSPIKDVNRDFENSSVGSNLLVFVFQCFLYGFIAWYMDLVMPGKYGSAKQFDFLFKRSKKNVEINEMILWNESNSQLFEDPPNGYEVGISVKYLHKHFGNIHAVDGINLDFYEGQITALLGYNGAGKTTLMSIISGLFSPSYGSVEFNGGDIFSNIDQYRKHLGFCPQHNLHFSYLTTLNHLIFFGMLKGMTLKNAKSEGLHLLKLLNILNKKDSEVNELSGGMKRKVSLAIALVGCPDILILDEPTSGMDTESRREMWDLILSLRGSKTILITTHFMDEADVLGDRIAIMDHGKIKFYGTSSYLKKAYETGYNLTIVKEHPCDESKIMTHIRKIIPEVKIQSSINSQLIINIADEYNDRLLDLLRMIEEQKKEFCIKGMGIACTTLEEVFLRLLRSLDDSDESKESVASVPNFIPNNSNRINFIALKKEQFKVLMEKNIIYTYRRWRVTLIFGIMPVFFGILLAGSYYKRYALIIRYIFFNPSLLYYQGYCMELPFNERVSGIKHLQLMTKLSPIMYWATCFLWDYFCYTTIIIVTLISMYLFDENNVYTDPNVLCVLFSLLLAFGWSGIINAYVYSFFMKTYIGSMVLYIVVNLIIFSAAGISLYLNIHGSTTIISMTRYVFLMVPYSSFLLIMHNFLKIMDRNDYITGKSRHVVPGNNIDKPLNYFVFKSEENEYGILEETLCLLFSSILYIVLIMFFEYKIFERLYNFGFNKLVDIYKSDTNDREDSDIDEERHKVKVAKKHFSGDPQSPIFIVDDLVKKFSSKFTGVRGISFTVSPGECFGLLGVNGAGKTTTFRILTGEIFPSKGNAFICSNKSYNLNSDTSQFVSLIGYCPQFDGLNNQLTGRETLKLMAILRGISPKDTKRHVDNWITLMDLEECKDRMSGTYSGGDKRKLSTAMALIGDPPVVFLDEPTSGVDPISRRNLWKLLTSNRVGGQAIILTSHSMDECEALCDRLTIMVDGVLKCIGNVQYLKNRYGQGYTVMIKLNNNHTTMNVLDLKTDIERRFSPWIHLKDEHTGLLHYHITNPQILLSDIFGLMKLIKENYSSIEDFNVCDTTLEQVFIAFAKRQAVLNANVLL